MTDQQLSKLNSVQHASLRVARKYSKALGDDVMTCLVFTTEMRTLQGTYPLLMQHIDGNPVPLPVALLGVENKENLFLCESDSGWATDTIPMMMQKGPFYIAKEQDKTGASRTVIAVDEHHPKINAERGEPLFTEAGGHSPYLEQIIAVLEKIEASHPHTIDFANTLNNLELITPLDFRCTLNDGSTHTLTGFFGIDEERLQKLPKDALAILHEQGHLLPVFMMLASQSQVAKLLAKKNDRL
jgi:hypothetical protein